MNRKPIFDVVRALIRRKFTQADVAVIDRAIDAAMANGADALDRLGALSEHYESGGRGPGAVSGGTDDPGGVSYGLYQLASEAGTAAQFVKIEGLPWARDFAGAVPGSTAFSAAWKAIARREPNAFSAAQHAFINRTHYRPAVAAVLDETGLDLDARGNAVRNVTWSVAVQHGRAVQILNAAVRAADAILARDLPGYDTALINAVYDARADYVLGIAARSSLGARRTLESVVRNRYPAERRAALAMQDGSAAVAA